MGAGRMQLSSLASFMLCLVATLQNYTTYKIMFSSAVHMFSDINPPFEYFAQSFNTS